MYSVQFCNGGDPKPIASNYDPVHLDISNRTNAYLVAKAFRSLHPGLLWVVVEHNGSSLRIVDYL
jgi:hypothetical protein